MSSRHFKFSARLCFKNITFTCSQCVLWCYDDMTLSLAVFSSTCFLAPDNPAPLLRAEWQRVSSGCHLAWPWQRSTWLQAAYTFLCGESAYDIDTLSQLEWAVFRPWKPMLLSVTGVVLRWLWIPVKTHHCCSFWQF